MTKYDFQLFDKLMKPMFEELTKALVNAREEGASQQTIAELVEFWDATLKPKLRPDIHRAFMAKVREAAREPHPAPSNLQ